MRSAGRWRDEERSEGEGAPHSRRTFWNYKEEMGGGQSLGSEKGKKSHH